jgi:glycerol-3-phosphate dehydrogenase (NAD(P)+)
MIRIVGAGAWGTALAVLWSHGASEQAAQEPIELVARGAAEAEAIRIAHRNERRLRGVDLPLSITIRSLDNQLAPAGPDDLIVIAVPSDSIASTLLRISLSEAPLLIVSKGLSAAGERPSEAALAAGINRQRIALLSGPNLAGEIAAAMPAAAVLAGPLPLVEALQLRLARPTLRLYVTDDVIGVEVAGAMKNVIAIAVSAVRALGYGENAAAALLSRGVAEMVRLTEACGGRGETACGLAGVGDLVLTASNTGSRNARFGALLASGESVAAAVATIGATIEGIPTAHGALALAARLGVELPITAAVVSVLEHGTPVAAIAKGLLGRSPAREWR